MNHSITSIILGIIEGITEFLPISSTGHLLIAEKLGLGHRSDLFNVVIQAGAILAITMVYWKRLWSLATGFSRPENRDYAFKLLGAFVITGILGLIVSKMGFELPTAITPVAWALLIGGIWIIFAEWIAAGKADTVAITWNVAVAVGVGQIVAAIFPGASRSGVTIFAAMLLGTSNRAAATEFTFLVGIPTMYAASGKFLWDAYRHGGGENWSDLGIAFVVSTITAFLVVRWLLRYIKSHRFTIFAVYRIALGLLLLMFFRGQP
ncbi:MAG TPA: undecaprenyl-diphosphate phosphatase [Candidatus Acidoferrales bacterium]|nr:undecaprenyl-diphosphate phosphatase [Candidatus Acidoferrales bacterium]